MFHWIFALDMSRPLKTATKCLLEWIITDFNFKGFKVQVRMKKGTFTYFTQWLTVSPGTVF